MTYMRKAAAGGILGWLAVSSALVACGRAEAAGAAPAPSATPALSVKTVEATRKVLPKTLTITGTLIANRESEVAADVPGRVIEAAVERGQRVEKGAPLARLDSRAAVLSRAVASAELDTARAHNDNAKVECERAEQLFASNAVSRAELDRVRAACRASETSTSAALARKRVTDKAIHDSLILAPFAGMITERSVELGEYVTPGRRIATLVEVNPLRLELSIPESASGSVQEGRDVEFSVKAIPDRRFKASVRYVGPVLRRSTHDLVVEALVDNSDGALRPGMFAEAEISTGELALPVVPKQALRGSGASARVFVVANGVAQERVVHVGSARADELPVIHGVAAGERVVVSPGADLTDGARVR